MSVKNNKVVKKKSHSVQQSGHIAKEELLTLHKVNKLRINDDEPYYK